jgi:hypothetical protein
MKYNISRKKDLKLTEPRLSAAANGAEYLILVHSI